MAQERIELPKFSGEADDFCVWWVQAESYIERFSFSEALSVNAEPDLPAAEGPGANADEQAAVDRNRKMVGFLMNAMPKKLVITLRAVSHDTQWPTKPKAHLMIAYLKSKYVDTSTLARFGAKHDLESCTMKKDGNPADLFDQLAGVRFKYADNRAARVTEDDLVAQAIQSLPAMYNSTVASVVAAAGAANPVAFAALRQAVESFYTIAMKGKPVASKAKDIEGGFAAVEEEQNRGTLHDTLKRLVQESVQQSVREWQHPLARSVPINDGPSNNMQRYGSGGSSNVPTMNAYTGQAYTGQPGYNGVNGIGLRYDASSGAGVIAGGHGGGAAGPVVSNSNYGVPNAPGSLTAEMLMAIMQAGGMQLDTSTMLCYHCGRYGHRSNECKNPKNFELVHQVLTAQGRKPCDHCGKFGHPSHLCWNLESNANTRPMQWRGPTYTAPGNVAPKQYESGNVSVDQHGTDSDSELSLAIGHLDNADIDSLHASLKAMGLCLHNPNVWIGDTGATTHNTAYIEHTINHRAATAADNIVGVTGPPATAATIVDIPCSSNQNGKSKQHLLRDVTYVPDSRYNLFSITKLMAKGWNLSGCNSMGLVLKKDGQTLHFDKTVHTPKGVLYVIVLERTGGSSKETPYNIQSTVECSASFGTGMAPIKPITINKAHDMCGHMGPDETRAICRLYNMPLTPRGFQQCVSCGRAKARQLAVQQCNEQHEVAGPNEHRIFIDISSVKHGSNKKIMTSKPYWMLIVVEYANFKLSEFLQHKSDLPETACEAVRKLKVAGVNVKHVRLDNAGENKSFADMANNRIWDLQLTFEFTGAGTPQRNYLVEVGFRTLWGRLRALFDAAEVPEEEKYRLVREGVQHLTFLDGLIVQERDGVAKTRYGWIFGNNPVIVPPLRVWGEAGIVKIPGVVKSKLQARGEIGMFVGYARSSAPDTCRMYLPTANSIHETRDVQWSKRMFFAKEREAVVAADSVIVAVNRQTVPLRTQAPAQAPQPAGRPTQAPPRNPVPAVRFRSQVEYVPEAFDGAESEAASVQGSIARGQPTYIEFIYGDEFSSLSSSIGKTRHATNGNTAHELNDDGDGDAGSDEMPELEPRPDDTDSDEGSVGDMAASQSTPCRDDSSNQQSRASSQQNSAHTLSSYRGSVVDSDAYTDDTSIGDEDDDAFIERLADMAEFAELNGNNEASEPNPPLTVRTRRSGRVIRAPKRLINETSGMRVEAEEVPRTANEMSYWHVCLQQAFDKAKEEVASMTEFAMVGAGIGGGFAHTTELHVKKYNEAMLSNDIDELAKWVKGIDEEHARFICKEVWAAVPKEDYMSVVPITMTWALKQKASGAVRARCNVRGFEQIPHVHYDPESKSSPVTTQAAVFIAFVLLMMHVAYTARIIDVKGAFLKGKFESDDEVLLLEVPQGFRWVYDKVGDIMAQRRKENDEMTQEQVKEATKEVFKEWLSKSLRERINIMKAQRKQRDGSRTVYLRMLRTIYGSVQAARAFWKELLKAFEAMGYTRSTADPCLYYKWDDDGELCMWLTWIDDCIVIGKEDVVARESAKLMSLFECEDVGPMTEYVGNKIEMSDGVMKLTQPVLIQSFVDKFDVKPVQIDLPAKQGQVLSKGNEGRLLRDTSQTKYRSGVGKLRYLATWSRPDILNAVREVSRFGHAPVKAHFDAMIRVMEYCVATPNVGRQIAPMQRWNGDRQFEFIVSGASDAAFNQCPDTRKSVSGNTTEVMGVPVITKSVMQETVKLSVTEAELDSAVTNVQDMLFVRQILESMGLRVKLPMILRVDNTGVRELVNNWSVGGRTRHVANKAMFLRELKEWGVLKVVYLPGGDMYSDVFTKNLPKGTFDRHNEHYVTDKQMTIDEPLKPQQRQQQKQQQQQQQSVVEQEHLTYEYMSRDRDFIWHHPIFNGQCQMSGNIIIPVKFSSYDI